MSHRLAVIGVLLLVACTETSTSPSESVAVDLSIADAVGTWDAAAETLTCQFRLLAEASGDEGLGATWVGGEIRRGATIISAGPDFFYNDTLVASPGTFRPTLGTVGFRRVNPSRENGSSPGMEPAPWVLSVGSPTSISNSSTS